ncbi:MAG: hypothetical protein H7A32_02795 [Deltaproteobacteria bacterium]|nr:hypothetical protein [Deltaproteobacteria bacterium]
MTMVGGMSQLGQLQQVGQQVGETQKAGADQLDKVKEQANQSKGADQADKKGAEGAKGNKSDPQQEAMDKMADGLKQQMVDGLFNQAFGGVGGSSGSNEATDQLNETAKALTQQLQEATNKSVNDELHGPSKAEEGPKNARAATDMANNEFSL